VFCQASARLHISGTRSLGFPFLTVILEAAMIFPLEELIKFTGNIYEITCAASRRAFQISMVRDPVIEENEDKVVSIAARQIFRKQVQYRLEQ
jgi:DNA-directed RNA polymerase subunit omega